MSKTLNYPPVVLVQTWLSNLASEHEAVRVHAEKMLFGAFGDKEAIARFVAKHRLTVD